MHYAVEDGNEVFYTVVQKGTPKENRLFLKMKTDSSILQKITARAEAGFKTPNEWRITSAVPGPDGSIFIANGYGEPQSLSSCVALAYSKPQVSDALLSNIDVFRRSATILASHIRRGLLANRFCPLCKGAKQR
jgi:hypothetical protein